MQNTHHASSAPTTESPFVTKLRQVMKCRKSGKLFSRPVTVIPCGDTLSELVVKKLMQETQPAVCLLCNRVIEKYVVNFSLDGLAELFLKEEAGETGIVEGLVGHLQAVAHEKLMTLPFPEEAAEFDCRVAWGRYKTLSTSPERRMELVSTNGSVLTRVGFYGSEDDSFFIRLWYQKKAEQTFLHYLHEIGFLEQMPRTEYTPSFITSGSIDAKTSLQLEIAFYFLAMSNVIPGEQFDFIYRLIHLKKWRQAEREVDQCLLPKPRLPHLSRSPYDPIYSNCRKDLECSISMELFQAPVIALDCGHSFSQHSAITMFGAREERVIKGIPPLKDKMKTCPVCSTSVMTYIDNLTLAHMAHCIQRIQKSAIYLLPVRGMEVVRMRPEIFTTAFPGKYADFVCSTPWGKNCFSAPDGRSMIFKSTQKGSLLFAFIITGRANGSVMMEFSCLGEFNEQRFLNYLFNTKVITRKERETIHHFQATTPCKLTDLVNIFEMQNKEHPEALRFLKRLIEMGDWRSVEEEIKRRWGSKKKEKTEQM